MPISLKMAVYNAVCLSILLYGCECWAPYRHPHSSSRIPPHIRCLHGIQRLRWWNKVPTWTFTTELAVFPMNTGFCKYNYGGMDEQFDFHKIVYQLPTSVSAVISVSVPTVRRIPSFSPNLLHRWDIKVRFAWSCVVTR